MRLPETWVEARLTDVCELNPRLTAEDRPDENTIVTFVPMSAVDEDGGVINKPETRSFAEVAKGYTSFRERDVLFAKVTPCMENGKAAIARDLENGLGFGSTEFHVLRPTEAVLPEYVFSFIRQKAFRDRAASAFVGTGGLQRVPPDFLSRVKIPLPTLPEQQRIVDVLRQAEVVSNLANQAEELLDSLAKQRFVEMFGHPAENSKEFETATFESFGTLDRGISKHRPRDASHLFGGLYPFIQTGDVSNAGDWLTTYKASYSESGLAQSRLWPKGTLCITIAANIAKAAILEFDACFPDSVVGFTPNEGVSSEYVLYCLRFYQEYFEHRAPKSAQMNINLDTLRTLRMPKPPEALQLEFAGFVREIRALKTMASGQADRRNELLKELTISAFTGELTAAWRQAYADDVAAAALARDQVLRERGARITLSTNVVTSATAQAEVTVRPARHWLLGELSEFQRQVLKAFTEYCQQSDQPLLVEDPDVFAHFCDNESVVERLQSFGQFHGNRIRRSLSQLAALGLIAKITLPKQDLDTGERDYLKAFRPLRSEEFTRMADVKTLREALSNTTEQHFYFAVQLDYETSERTGAGGMFQVISVEDEDGKDFTLLVDQGQHYRSLDELKGDLASALKVTTGQVELEEV